jgi:hypothetical protein
MFRYNPKRVNKEYTEFKKMLDIMRSTAKKSSKTNLNENLDTFGMNNQMQNQTNMGNEFDTSPTDEIKTIEQAIQNSTIEKTTSDNNIQNLTGYISGVNGSKSLYFSFKSDEAFPSIQTDKSIILDESMLKSINQISAYFETWKENPNQ